MWKLQCAASTPAPQGESHPLLATLNHFGGRQTWEYDPKAGTPEELAKVEELRENFTKYRHHQKHSADELLRLQCASKIEAKKYAPPSTSLPNTTPTAKRVEDHLKGAIAYYECLQQEDGHWPGDYGGPLFLMPGQYMPNTHAQIGTPLHKRLHTTLHRLRAGQEKAGGAGSIRGQKSSAAQRSTVALQITKFASRTRTGAQTRVVSFARTQLLQRRGCPGRTCLLSRRVMVR